MASDGQVLIDSKLNTNGIKQGIKELKNDFTRLSREVTKLVDQIENGLSDIEIDDVGKELSESIKKGADDINDAFEGATDQAEVAADQMADAMDDAADKIAADSDSMADSVKDDLDDIGDKAEQTGEEVKDGLTGAFKEIFSANIVSDIAMQGLEKLGDIAKDVAKQSVEAAAEIKASNAQFEQTFKGVEATAKKSLDNIAKQTGITATRMQDSYTSIFAFSKSVGADTEAALDISSRAMIAAADSAAYYDRSIEEATETLQSFLKGNYENDAALGIAATETTRNAKANELYAKSFQELSESQKVDVLLAMVEAGNQASGALGQAAREADSWTNVVGEATEAWRQLIGVLGEPILDNLAPAVQRVTEMLQKMVEVSASTELKKGLEDIAESFDNANEQFANTSAEIDFSAAKAEYYAEKLEELEEAGLKSAESQQEYAAAVQNLNTLVPGLNLVIDENTGLVNKNRDAILAEVNAMKKQAQYVAYQELYAEIYRAQADAHTKGFTAAQKKANILSEIDVLQGQLKASTQNATEAELANAEAANLAAEAFDRAGIAGLGLELALGGIKTENEKTKETIASLNTEVDELQGVIDAAAEEEAEYTARLEETERAMKDLEAQIESTSEAEENLAESSEVVAEAQKEIAESFEEARQSARDSIDSQIGYFEKLKLEGKTSSAEIVANWEKQQEAFNNYTTNLQKALDMGLADTLVKELSDGSSESMIYLEKLVNDNTRTVDEINAAWEGAWRSRQTSSDLTAAILQDYQILGEEAGQIIAQTADGFIVSFENAAASIDAGATGPIAENAESSAEAVGEAYETAANTVEDKWKGKAQWYDSNVSSPIKTSTEGVKTTALRVWSDIETENREAWTRMVGDVQKAISDMQTAIDSLKGKTVDVGVNSSYASYASAAEWATPVLASGTVIPTMAISSVQRSAAASADNGLILDYLERLTAKAEAQDNILEAVLNVTFAGELAPLVRLLYPEIQAEVRRKGTSLAEVHTE